MVIKTKMTPGDLALVQNTIFLETHRFFARRHMITVPLPPTVGIVSCPKGAHGTDSQAVKIHIDGNRGLNQTSIYLCDSFQFYLEYLCRFNGTGVYSINPSHRGDPRDSTHLNVFSHIEAEILGTIDDEMRLAEKLLHYLVFKIMGRYEAVIARQAGSTRHLELFLEQDRPLPRVSIDDAEKIVGKNGIKIHKHPFFRAITREGELKLIEEFGGSVWLTPMDHGSVSFFQAFHDEDRTKAKSADLLMGLGELIGSGQRHTNPEDLIEAINLHRLAPDFYRWYIELRETNIITTSGFGMGVERFLAWVFQSTDIRDFDLFPRDYNKNHAFVP